MVAIVSHDGFLIVMWKERVDSSAPTLSATIQSSLQQCLSVQVSVHGLVCV
jgi:hypothetical protein